MVSTLDFESSDPSSNLGRTSSFFTSSYLAVMSGVAQKNAFARTLFNFAYDYKLKKVEKNQSTPILDSLLFKNTANLLGGRLRIFISGGAPLDVKTQRFINVCICTAVTGGYGLTETTASTTLQDPFDNRSGTVGPLIERFSQRGQPRLLKEQFIVRR